MFGLFGGKSFDPEKDIPDLSGKVIIVTGGTDPPLILGALNTSQILTW